MTQCQRVVLGWNRTAALSAQGQWLTCDLDPKPEPSSDKANKFFEPTQHSVGVDQYWSWPFVLKFWQMTGDLPGQPLPEKAPTHSDPRLVGVVPPSG